jgi:hypothetical protein
MDTNAFLATGHIALWMLVLGLFLPRLTLFLAWLGPGIAAADALAPLVNFIGWLFLPRFLFAFYIYSDMGPNNIWFWAYLATGIAGFFGETGYARHRIVRRTTVSRDGRTTTIVEEEEV